MLDIAPNDTQAGRSPQVLPAGVVDLWRLSLAALYAGGVPEEELGPEERARAAGFDRAAARLRFVAGRLALRRVLSRYLGVAPAEVLVVDGPCRWCGAAHGKPRLADDAPRFNLSRSGDLVVLAVTADQDVGVDVQRMQAPARIRLVARHAFRPDEQRALAALDPIRRPAAGWQLWARKEAYVKATGWGLDAMARVSVSVPPAPPRVGDEGWTLRDLELPAAYVGAVAVAGPAKLRVMDGTTIDGRPAEGREQARACDAGPIGAAPRRGQAAVR